MISLVKVGFLLAVVAVWILCASGLRGALRLFFMQLVLTAAVETLCAVLLFLGYQNIAIYNAYLPLEFLLLLGVSQLGAPGRWVAWSNILAVLLYAGLLVSDYFGRVGDELLFSHSLLFAWGYLAVLFTYLLVHMARSTVAPIWEDPHFWVYLSVVLFFGASLPFVGLLNKIYRSDEALASDLVVILDILYFTAYGMVGLAGWLRLRARATA